MAQMADRLREIQDRKLAMEAEFTAKRERKAALRDQAAGKVAAGENATEERREIRDIDGDLDLLAAALEKIEGDIAEAKHAAAVETRDEAVERMRAVEERASGLGDRLRERVAELSAVVVEVSSLESEYAGHRRAMRQGAEVANVSLALANPPAAVIGLPKSKFEQFRSLVEQIEKLARESA